MKREPYEGYEHLLSYNGITFPCKYCGELKNKSLFGRAYWDLAICKDCVDITNVELLEASIEASESYIEGLEEMINDEMNKIKKKKQEIRRLCGVRTAKPSKIIKLEDWRYS